MRLLFVVLVVSVASVVADGHKKGDGWEWWCKGECVEACADCTSEGGFFIQGGSTSSDEAWKWFVNQANGGNVVILRASHDGSMNDYVYEFGVKSVSTILFTDRRASSDQFVLSILENANGVFFAGGDQSKYFNYWNGTKLTSTLQQKVDNDGLVLGGSSAGMAILAGFIYTAERAGAVSDEALADPYNRDMTFGESIVDVRFLRRTVTDTHFYQRDRMGRYIAFLSRASVFYDNTVYGVACDERTAVRVDKSGIGTVSVQGGTGYCYFTILKNEPERCEPGRPLIVTDVPVVKVAYRGRFDFQQWRPYDGDFQEYTLSASAGELSSDGNNGRIYA